MTGVSQATVSVVLNGRSDSEVKIAPETRDRVLRAIAETGYVADPVARRLAARHNRIIGVFTYEPVFPSGNSDFYHPFLVGIEQRAEALGCDLLLLTSAPVLDGRRRIFSHDNRLRLADGCVLLGRSLDRDELAKLVADGLPFVSIGRRDDAGGPVPYVGADYAAAVAELVRHAAVTGPPTAGLPRSGRRPGVVGRPHARLPRGCGRHSDPRRAPVTARGRTSRHRDRNPRAQAGSGRAAGRPARAAGLVATGQGDRRAGRGARGRGGPVRGGSGRRHHAVGGHAG